MNTLCKTLLAASLLLPLTSYADSWFIKPYVGLSQISDVSGDAENINNISGNSDINLDTGFNVGLSGGYYYNDSIAVEFGWEYRSNDSETNLANSFTYPDGNYASNTFYLNGLYHFAKTVNWQPYLGGGLIWVQEIDIDLEFEGNELSFSSDGDIGFQVMAGINYHLNNDWLIQLEARYSDITDIDLSGEERAIGNISGLDYQPVTLQVGLIYKF
ncbi:outer membrane protein [Thalassotalea euphylliae]|uniref:Porin family protein n=1 Tax=Thalassotalea euphylliae TaxID=1655234 RepID=A0A3E0UIG0_9GAMM|nr:porin family protein [Thalassotalea euphylliae]REL35985.1 porin family protein [Thalassotalea euphylliae]